MRVRAEWWTVLLAASVVIGTMWPVGVMAWALVGVAAVSLGMTAAVSRHPYVALWLGVVAIYAAWRVWA